MIRCRAVSLAIALLCALGTSVTTTCDPARADDREIAIGTDLPLSGIDGTEGVPVRNAVRLAIERENARGFPGGYHVTLVDLDDTIQGKHDPAQGALNFKSLVADSRVLAVVGPMNSNIAKVQIPISNASGLAEISFAATAVELTRGPGARALRSTSPDLVTFFRVCTSDDRQGALLARFALSRGWKSAFVIDDNETYGRGLADVFAPSYTQAGGKLLGREHLLPFQLDYKPLLTKVAAFHPQAIFFGGITSTGGGILRKQMVDAGMLGIAYIGGDGLAGASYPPLAGAGVENTYLSSVAPDITKLPGAQSFKAAFLKRFGTPTAAYAPGGYAAAIVELEAIRRLLGRDARRVPTRDAVRGEIAKTHGLATPIGPIAFDPQGDLLHPTVSIYTYTNGKERFVTQTTEP